MPIQDKEKKFAVLYFHMTAYLLLLAEELQLFHTGKLSTRIYDIYIL
ncbi:MAG: hypothetical protein ACI90V_007727 [Bacillariaceae sp.]|jgi:hypothetical protein